MLHEVVTSLIVSGKKSHVDLHAGIDHLASSLTRFDKLS